MKISEFLEKQFELDESILANLCLRQGKDTEHIELLDKRFTALFVELAEFIQAETKGEKLEEYADIMHFLLSIINTLDIKIAMFEREFKEAFTNVASKGTDSGMELFKAVGNLANETKCFKYWSTKEKNKATAGVQFLTLYTFIVFLQLGKENGFNAEEIEAMYEYKNNKNYERQKNNY